MTPLGLVVSEPIPEKNDQADISIVWEVMCAGHFLQFGQSIWSVPRTTCNSSSYMYISRFAANRGHSLFVHLLVCSLIHMIIHSVVCAADP